MKYIKMFEDIEPLNRGKPTKGEILDIKNYKPFTRYGVKFDNYDDIYIVYQDQFKIFT